MKIVDDYSNSGDVVILDKVTVEYSQDLDSCQSESDHPEGYQILKITTDDAGGGKFIRINTGEAGWSINDIDDLVYILNDFKNRFKV